jgi:hypothetical protein
MAEKPLAAKISKAVAHEKVVLSNIAPVSGTSEVKTSIGVTFNQISEAVQKALPVLNYQLGDNACRIEVIDLVEKLHNAVRLPEWEYNQDGTYQLWAVKVHPQVYVSVSAGVIELVKGLRRYPLASEPALGLFRMLEQAQEFLKHNLKAEALEIELEEAAPQKASPPKLCRRTLEMEDGFEFLKSLQGRVLTIVEATFAEKSQREAVKTLVRKEFRRSMDKISRFCLFPNESSSDMYGDEQGV